MLKYLLFLLLITGCTCSNEKKGYPDKFSRVVIYNTCGSTDTIFVEYYRSLHIGGYDDHPELRDDEGEIKARGIKAFSVLDPHSKTDSIFRIK